MWASTSTSLKISEGVSYSIRQIFNGRARNDTQGVACDAETRFYGRPSGRSDYGQRNKKRTTERFGFLRVSAISRPLALFSPPSFLLREKRWCRRRHPAPAAQRADSTRKGCAASVVHLTALTAAQSRPPLQDVGSVSTSIRQIFNGREQESIKEPKHKPAKRLCFGKDEQRNGRAFTLAWKRGIWSL